MADFGPLKPLKLISRKIWVAGNFWKFLHCVHFLLVPKKFRSITNFHSFRSSVLQQQQSQPKNPPAPPKRLGSTLSSTNPNAGVQVQDEVKIYEVEDTPLQLSGNTSFSDLTVDEPQNSGRVSVDSNDGLIQHHPGQEIQPHGQQELPRNNFK